MKKIIARGINRLLFLGFTLSLAISCRKDNTFVDQSVRDIDGNSYDSVTIGKQTWMTENLRTTRLNDNTPIPLVTENELWGQLSEPAYCWYNNNGPDHKTTYGALYNWYTVNTGKLCPAGWHVPSDEEFKTLEKYLGMSQSEADALNWHGTDQGTRMKETSGWNLNGNGTNTSGFSAIPGGYRDSDGVFDSIGFNGYWWSSSIFTEQYNSWIRYLTYYENRVNRIYGFKPYGFSVRCLKD